MAESFFLGFVLVTLFFFLSLFLVLGIKLTIYSIKSYFNIEPEKPTAVVRQRKPRQKKPASPPLIRSIEINPEEIDRIYVKKTG